MGYDIYLEQPLAAEEELRKVQERLRSAEPGTDEWLDLLHKDEDMRGYWRSNIWGMGRLRDIMEVTGMATMAGFCEWPTIPDIGECTWQEVDDALEGHGSVPSDILARVTAYRDQVDAHLKAKPPVRGIALWKLCSNDGWLVTPGECETALDLLNEWLATAQTTLPTVRKRLNKEVEGSGDRFVEWTKYLRTAAKRGGFRVY